MRGEKPDKDELRPPFYCRSFRPIIDHLRRLLNVFTASWFDYWLWSLFYSSSFQVAEVSSFVTTKSQ